MREHILPGIGDSEFLTAERHRRWISGILAPRDVSRLFPAGRPEVIRVVRMTLVPR